MNTNFTGIQTLLNGVWPIANGGTNSSTALNNNRVIISSAGAIIENAALTASRPMKTNGSGLPTATQIDLASTNDVTGILPIANGGTNSAIGPVLAVSSKTTTYIATTADGLILCSGSAFTVTLPAATSLGKVLQIKKTDASLTNIITIARAGSDTITDNVASLTSTTLNTMGETVTLVADGTATWQVVNRTYSKAEFSYTPTFTGLGTVTNIATYWSRRGSMIHIRGYFTTGTTTATPGLVSLPSGATAASTITTGELAGKVLCGGDLGTQNDYQLVMTASTTTVTFSRRLAANSDNPMSNASNANSIVINSANFTVQMDIPISGWN